MAQARERQVCTAHPPVMAVYLVFDSNAPAAIASRKRLFAEAARHDWWVGGAHLPFPGLGHVVPYGKKSYHWVRGEFSPLP